MTKDLNRIQKLRSNDFQLNFTLSRKSHASKLETANLTVVYRYLKPLFTFRELQSFLEILTRFMDATMSSNNNYRLWNYPNQSGAQGTSTQGFFASKPKPTPKSQLPNQNESWEREQQQHQNSAAFQTGYGGKSSQLYQHQVHQQQQRNFPSKRAHDITLSPSTPKTSMASSSSSYSPPKHNVPKISRLGLGHAQVQQPNKPKVKFFNKNNPNNSFKKTPKPEQDVTAKNQVRYSNLVANDKEKEWTSLFQQTIERINFCPDGGIVNTLLYYLQPPRASRNAMKAQITNQMQNLMSPLGVKDISVFGSTLTELDFIGSDLDYHVQLQVPPSNNESVIKILNQVAHLSRTRSYDFRVIYMIQHARIPIIRLLHLQTKTTCDVNFTSKFGYFNSCFIGHLLSYDFRIKELAVILKLWSKSYKIADKMILSNYCLVMLLIFYLQNLDVPMLDTIKNNQASRSPMIIDPKLRWNVFFSDKINRSHENNQTTRELLIGFFEFYHKLNFGNYIVSMYNGDLIPRNLFDGHPDFETYRQVVAQCELLPLKFDNPQMLIVQDGFEQNLNVGIKCKKHVDSFTEMIKLSYLKCTELKNETFSQLTIKLLTGITIPVNLDKSGYKAKKKSSMTIYSIAGDLKVRDDLGSLR